MRRYSRRHFLQLSGIALLSTQVQTPWFYGSQQSAYKGRVLEATPVYIMKDQLAPIVRCLWPDSIIKVLDGDENWYRAEGGFVQRIMVQPMMSSEPNLSPAKPPIPFWAEVTGPVAPVRQWCAADAPPVTRIGHGGIARVIDYLPGGEHSLGWYGLDDGSGDFLGWTQAARWRPAHEETLAGTHPTLYIDRSNQLLTAYDDGEEVLRAPLSTGTEIFAGTYLINRRQISGAPIHISGHIHAYYGVPWRIQFGESYEMTGAYWHNRFGAPLSGPAVQVTPLLARWLYHWLGENGMVTVI